MSRKPTIKISYPEASEKALQLTEAMVKRAPGKRIVETESEDPISPDGGDLFSGFIRCKTQTGVELTLTLNSYSMDYALETLIRPNLTADERKRILGKDSEQIELALTPGEQEKKIEIGKIPDRDLRTILADLIQKYKNALVDDPERLIQDTIKEIDYKAGVIDLAETYEYAPAADLEKIILEALQDHIPDADYITKTGLMSDLAKRINLHLRILRTQNGEQKKTETAINITCMLAALLDCIQRKKAKTVNGERELCTFIVNHIRGLKQDFCFSANEIAGIMEISAKLWFENDYKCPGGAPIFLFNMLYHIVGQDSADKYNKTCNDCDHYDPADGICEIDKQEKDFRFPACNNFTPETDTAKESQGGEIDPGLLNDLDDGSDGMAPAEEVMGHDE